MFVYTLSKKRAFRMALIILAVFVGIAIGIAAILTAVNTSAAENKLPIYSVERGDNKISLTFDCAWGNSNTDELLTILSNAEVKASFFVTGEFCDKYPDDVRKMADAGHEIANHSDKHPHLKGININKFISDTKECSRKIKMLVGVEPTLYRAPYGEYDNNTVSTINGMNMSFIQWSADSIDWQEPDAATITNRILENTKSGSILLFHNDLKNTTEALPGLLTKLKQSGFEFAKVSDLIYTKDYKIDNAGKQIQVAKPSVVNVPVYSNNTIINDALNVLRTNFSFEEISAMKNGITPEMAVKLAPLLSSEQIAAMTALSGEQYTDAWTSLMAAVVQEGEIIEGTENLDEQGTLGEPIFEETEEAEQENIDESFENIEPISDYDIQPYDEAEEDSYDEILVEEDYEIPSREDYYNIIEKGKAK